LTSATNHRTPDQEITQFVLRENNEEGRLAWILRATKARVYEGQDEVEADEVHIDFYDAAGKVSSVLTADLGVIARRTNDMRAMGNVVVRNRQGHELTTEELHYLAEKNKIRTDKFVRIVRGRDVLTGYGLTTDPDLGDGRFEIERDVRATVLDLPEAGVDSQGAEQKEEDGSSAADP
jgi:LPS export ABC transporter protein LptC